MSATDDDPPWLVIALREQHVHEIPGPADNPRILEYLRTTTLASRPEAIHDSTPWCASFVNWCMLRAGYPGTLRANARSWLEYGIPLQLPRRGAIAVFSAPARGPNAGHVGFFERATPHTVLVYGGNQRDRVSLAPYDRLLLLGYRWPTSPA